MRIWLNPNDQALTDPLLRPLYEQVCKDAQCVPLTAMFGWTPGNVDASGFALDLANTLGVSMSLRVAPPDALDVNNHVEWRRWIAKFRMHAWLYKYYPVGAVLLNWEGTDVRRMKPELVAARANELIATIYEVFGQVKIIPYRFGESRAWHYSTYVQTGSVPMYERPLECFGIASTRAYRWGTSNPVIFDRMANDIKLTGLEFGAWVSACCGMGDDERTGRFTNDQPWNYVERARADGAWCRTEAMAGRMQHVVTWLNPVWVSRAARDDTELAKRELDARMQCWREFVGAVNA